MTEPYEYASAVPRAQNSNPPPDVKQILPRRAAVIESRDCP